MQKNRIAILASGNGSNAVNLMNTAQNLKHSSLVCLVCDQPGAPILEKVKAFESIESVLIASNSRKKSEFEKELFEYLISKEVNWIFLAGFMKILSPKFIEDFHSQVRNQNRIVNIHPSLLPLYKGLDSYERAFHDEVKEHGVSLHYVDAGIDTGPIIAQKSYLLEPSESLDSFKARGMNLEYQIYREFLISLDDNFEEGMYE